MVWGRTSLRLRPGTSHQRFARAWKSCSTGTQPHSIRRCPWRESAMLIGGMVGWWYQSMIFDLCLLICLVFRMQNVQAQQLLPWLPGSKPTSNTPTFLRGSSHWRESRLDYLSRNSNQPQTLKTHFYYFLTMLPWYLFKIKGNFIGWGLVFLFYWFSLISNLANWLHCWNLKTWIVSDHSAEAPF